jgi:hypothetical protein
MVPALRWVAISLVLTATAWPATTDAQSCWEKCFNVMRTGRDFDIFENNSCRMMSHDAAQFTVRDFKACLHKQ